MRKILLFVPIAAFLIGSMVYAASILSVSQGGTGAGTLPAMILQGNGTGAISGTSTPSAASFFATSSAATSTFMGGVFINTMLGIASSSPGYSLTLDASSTLVVTESSPATSTAMTVNWKNGNQQMVKFMAGAATTISFSNYVAGEKMTLVTCNASSGTAGALTFPATHYSGGIAPSNTTAANQCDIWYFLATNATSSLIVVLTGMTPGIQ